MCLRVCAAYRWYGTRANAAASEESVGVSVSPLSSLSPPQCLTSTKRLMGFRNSRGRSKQEKSKNTVASFTCVCAHARANTHTHSACTDLVAFEKCELSQVELENQPSCDVTQ